MAMLGFAGIALAELKDKVPAGEQLANDVVGVVLLSLTFTLASLLPKFLSGYSLKVYALSAVKRFSGFLAAVKKEIGLFMTTGSDHHDSKDHDDIDSISA